MSLEAELFAKHILVDFDSTEHVWVLFSEVGDDNKQPAGNVWLRFEKQISETEILVRAKQGTDGPEGTFPAKISARRALLVPHELEKDEGDLVRSGLLPNDVPIVMLRPNNASSDSSNFWLLQETENGPKIRRKHTAENVFESVVRPHEKRGQHRRVSLKEGWHFLEVDIGDVRRSLKIPAIKQFPEKGGGWDND